MYVAEIATLCAGILTQAFGLYESFNLCVGFGGAIPNVAAKYDLLLDRPARMTDLYGRFCLGIILLLLSLPFTCARASAIACLGTSGVFAVGFFYIFNTSLNGTANTIWQLQHREACRALARAEAEKKHVEPSAWCSLSC